MARIFSQQYVGTALVLLATIGFASQGIVIKFAFTEHAPIMAILLLRKVIFLPLYMLFSRFSVPKSASVSINAKTKIYAFIAGMFGYYLAPLCSLHALTHIDAGVERILLYCFPAIVMLLQAIIDRRPPPLSYLFVFALMQCGIFLTVESLHFTHDGLIGAFWALGAALSFAVYVIFNQMLVRRTGSTIFILYALYGATTAVTCHFLATEPFSSLHLTAQALLYVAIFALFSTFIPGYLFSEGVKRIGSSHASLISMACPALTVLFAYIFLHEVLTPNQLIGGGIIIAGILFLESKMLLQRKTPAAQNS